MSDLSVSVIIPVYNRKEELLKAIKSVLNQTYLPAEIIVVDDCSNFDVNNFLESNFSESMIKVSVNEVNMGAAKSRNVGINLSKSNYIAFLDSDDFWYEEKLESQISKILLNPELDLVYTDQFLKRNGKLFPSEKVLINERLSEKLITGWTAPNTSTLLFNKKSLLALGGFDDNLPSCQDHDLWFKLAKSNMCVDFVDKPLSVFVQESTNRISYHIENRMVGVEKFLVLWKNYIINTSGMEAYTRFKTDYFYKASYPVFAMAIKNRKFSSAIHIYLNYLALNKNFYRQVMNVIKGKFRFK